MKPLTELKKKGFNREEKLQRALMKEIAEFWQTRKRLREYGQALIQIARENSSPFGEHLKQLSMLFENIGRIDAFSWNVRATMNNCKDIIDSLPELEYYMQEEPVSYGKLSNEMTDFPFRGQRDVNITYSSNAEKFNEDSI